MAVSCLKQRRDAVFYFFENGWGYFLSNLLIICFFCGILQEWVGVIGRSIIFTITPLLPKLPDEKNQADQPEWKAGF